MITADCALGYFLETLSSLVTEDQSFFLKAERAPLHYYVAGINLSMLIVALHPVDSVSRKLQLSMVCHRGLMFLVLLPLWPYLDVGSHIL